MFKILYSYSQVNNALKYYDNLSKINNKLLFAEALDKTKWDEIKNDSYYAEMKDSVIKKSKEYLLKPINTLPYSLFKIFRESGSRKEYENVYFERRGILNTFAFMALLDADDKYLSALEDIIWAICDEFTWALPAHFGALDEKVLNPNDGSIDLFAAETAFTLAEIAYLLEDKLSKAIIYRVRKEINERILKPFCTLGTFCNWETSTDNWAAVCGGSIGAAAIYCINDSNSLTPIIHRVLGSLNSYLNGFKEDGVCAEGMTYWTYGFGYFTYFADLLRERTGGKINIFEKENEKLKQIAMFQQKCILTDNNVLSFSDSFTKMKFNIGLIHYFKGIWDEIEVPDSKYKCLFGDDHCNRFAPFIRDFVWSNSNTKKSLETMDLKSVSYVMKNSEWFVSRAISSNNIICFAAKAGNNNEPHNHNDVGNFIVHVNGDNLICDTGAGEYTADYFSNRRYEILCNSSLGHSLPIIDGFSQKFGADFTANNFSVSESDEKDIVNMDISKAYDNNNLLSLKRVLEFIKDEDTKLILTDYYNFIISPSEIKERFISFTKPSINNDESILLNGQNSSTEIIYDNKECTFSYRKVDFVNHFKITEPLYLLDFKITKPEINTKFSIELKISGSQK